MLLRQSRTLLRQCCLLLRHCCWCGRGLRRRVHQKYKVTSGIESTSTTSRKRPSEIKHLQLAYIVCRRWSWLTRQWHSATTFLIYFIYCLSTLTTNRLRPRITATAAERKLTRPSVFFSERDWLPVTLKPGHTGSNAATQCKRRTHHALSCVTANELPEISSERRKILKSVQICNRRQQLLLGSATWRTVRNITLSLILTHRLHCVKTWRHPQNRKYITYCIVVRGGPCHGQR